MREEILLNVESKQVRYAHLKNGQLHDLIVERKNTRQITGNVYRGKVKNILKNIQSAFIDIGEGENGFIHISDILENKKKFEERFEMDFDAADDKKESNSEEDENKDIDEVLKPEQPVLVQVVKEAIGSKGARLTSNIALAGRYLVLLPNTSHRGVSKKIEDRRARSRLKRMIRLFEMPKNIGLICRTASQNATPEMLIDEATDLFYTWEKIVADFEASDRPQLLYQESDLIKKALITAIERKVTRLLVDDYTVFQILKTLYKKYASEHPLRIEQYRDKMPIFERFQVEREIDRALGRKVWLPSGGYLFFDRTEAMHTVDVNSGRSSNDGGGLEETLVKINLEAAEEIARQLRIRNVGGLVVCDFIDMRSRKNQRRVLEKFNDAVKSDTAKCSILGMSEFGLVEMTRQRSRQSLEQVVFESCPYCLGKGLIKTYESTSIEIERALKKAIEMKAQYGLRLVCHPNMKSYLDSESESSYLREIADMGNALLELETDDILHLNDFQLFSTINGKRIEV
jgi:ribonuclease G